MTNSKGNLFSYLKGYTLVYVFAWEVTYDQPILLYKIESSSTTHR